MRVEEKQLDGQDLERREQREKSPLEQQYEHELPYVAGEALRDTGTQRQDEMLAFMRSILEGRTVDVGALAVPQREQRALLGLQAAVSGRSTDLNMFMYAEDRRDLLEQALAVLQPELISRDAPGMAAIEEQLLALTKQVTGLREELQNLEEGQDEVAREALVKAKAAAPESEDEPAEAGAPKPGTTLDGPEGAQVPASPGRAAPPKSGAEVDAQPAPSPTTLGDAAEIAAAARKAPWWRRARDG